MILLKAIAGGVSGVVLSWIAIIAIDYWRTESYNRKIGLTGLGATAGGWNYLVQLPLVVLILSAAFGIGFYLTVRWVVRS